MWTREAVKQLILRVLDIDMPISTVEDYLAKWQFTSKKANKRAYERKDMLQKPWLEIEYPKIKKKSKINNADVWWADETACVSIAINQKQYPPIEVK